MPTTTSMGSKPRLSAYFSVGAAAVAAFVLSLDWMVGLAFAVATASLVLPLYLMRVPQRYFYIQLFTAVALWITHLSRVPFLVIDPNYFMYARFGTLTPRLLAVTLLQFALYAALFFAGLFLALSRKGASPAAPRNGRDGLFLRASTVITLVALAVFLARAGLQLGFGLFTKHVSNPRIGFIGELLPVEMLYPVAILYLAKYRRRIPPFETLVFLLIAAGMVALTLVSGSRRSFASMGLAVFIYFLADKGDFRIGAMRAAVVVVGGAWLLMLSFALARPIRSLLRAEGGYSGQLGTVLVRGFKAAATPDAAVFLGNAVSRRLSQAMDGLVVVNMHRAPSAIEALSPSNTLARAVARFIPHYSASGSVGSGRAIGIAYSGHSERSGHAGALGLLASLNLTFGVYSSFVAVLAFGLFGGAYFRFTSRIRDPDIVYLLHFVGMQLTFAWILSGNLDGLISATILNMLLLSLYGFAMVMMFGAARLPREQPLRSAG